jgi:hypothetical protein
MVAELITALKKTCLEISLKLGADREAVSMLEVSEE